MKSIAQFLLPLILLFSSCGQENPVVLVPSKTQQDKCPDNIPARFNGFEVGECILQEDGTTYYLFLSQEVNLDSKTELVVTANDLINSSFYMDVSHVDPLSENTPDTLKYSIDEGEHSVIHLADSLLHLFTDTLTLLKLNSELQNTNEQ
ncbi:MAG: hypothetical protein ACPGED_08195 [Flavobacteriales bacterium]